MFFSATLSCDIFILLSFAPSVLFWVLCLLTSLLCAISFFSITLCSGLRCIVLFCWLCCVLLCCVPFLLFCCMTFVLFYTFGCSLLFYLFCVNIPCPTLFCSVNLHFALLYCAPPLFCSFLLRFVTSYNILSCYIFTKLSRLVLHFSTVFFSVLFLVVPFCLLHSELLSYDLLFSIELGYVLG